MKTKQDYLIVNGCILLGIIVAVVLFSGKGLAAELLAKFTVATDSPILKNMPMMVKLETLPATGVRLERIDGNNRFSKSGRCGQHACFLGKNGLYNIPLIRSQGPNKIDIKGIARKSLISDSCLNIEFI